MKYRIIKCKSCGKKKKHYAKELCGKCYSREYSRKYYHTVKGRNVQIRAMEKYSKTEKGKEVLRRYYKNKGKETIKKYQNSQKGKETRKKYLNSAKGKEIRKKINKKYNKSPKGREIRLKNAKKYSKTPKGKITRLRAKLNYRKKFPVLISYKDSELIKQRDGMRCVYCKKKVFEYPAIPNYHPQLLTYDHIDPNGCSGISNMVIACYKCNCSKHDKNVFDWCKERGIEVPEIFLKFNLGV
jgi:hypothetical protein